MHQNLIVLRQILVSECMFHIWQRNCQVNRSSFIGLDYKLSKNKLSFFANRIGYYTLRVPNWCDDFFLYLQSTTSNIYGLRNLTKLTLWNSESPLKPPFDPDNLYIFIKIAHSAWDLLTSSLGWTGDLVPTSPPRRRFARLEITSLVFMFDWVPEPVCQITKGKWPVFGLKYIFKIIKVLNILLNRL